MKRELFHPSFMIDGRLMVHSGYIVVPANPIRGGFYLLELFLLLRPMLSKAYKQRIYVSSLHSSRFYLHKIHRSQQWWRRCRHGVLLRGSYLFGEVYDCVLCCPMTFSQLSDIHFSGSFSFTFCSKSPNMTFIIHFSIMRKCAMSNLLTGFGSRERWTFALFFGNHVI